MPDGSYPIRSAKDVENAVRDYYRSGEKPDVKAHIIARAKAIGAEGALPDDWTEAADKAAAVSSLAGDPAPGALPRPPAGPYLRRVRSSTARRRKTHACARRSTIWRRRSRT